MSVPETRPSLLLRIRDREDRQAWNEFATLYRPVVCQMARHSGMQAADADDLAQQVLMAISRAIEGFDPDSGQARFRTWLKTIARRAIINAITRGTPDQAVGGSDVMDLLHQQPAINDHTETLMLQYRREIFLVAASQIRCEFEDGTWQAFWNSVVLGQRIDDVADSLNRTRGSIYTARSRVMKRLKDKVQELDLDSEFGQS
ncbi:MAG: sigma-70 family RNA polymerase sigma factor [Planctomycetales bacterium]|nr:sigma-70 family RNA polymerase sigma factor [Planctomycetales bacterium]